MSCDETHRRHLHHRTTHRHDIKKGDVHHEGKGHEHTHEEMEHEHPISHEDEHHHHDRITIQLSQQGVELDSQTDRKKPRSKESDKN